MNTTQGMTPEVIGRIDYAKTLDHRTKMIILFGVLLGLFLSALDQTIVSTAMPRIARELDGISLYSWVTTAYLLTNTALVPIYGKLSDLYGRKPVLMTGIVIFLIGSALCGMSGESFLGELFGGGMMQLVFFRAIQGVGAAGLGSVAFSIIADLFEPVDRPRYQGLFGAVFGLSSVIGPLAGGWLTDNVSWRWVFYVNLPLGILALAFLWFKMPKLASGLKAQVDWLGAALILSFAVPLLLALTWGANGDYSWTSTRVLGLFAISAASLVGFIFAETRHPSPIIPLKLFKNPTFAWGGLARFLFGASFLGAVLFLSLYLVQVQGVSATKAGIATVPLTFGLIFGAVMSGQIASRMGKYKPLMLAGLSITMLGFFALSTLTADSSYGSVVARMVLLGFGLGPALPLYTTALQLSVQPWEVGVATSAGQFFQQLGSTIGTAIFGALLSSGIGVNLAAAFHEQAKLDGNQSVASQLNTIADNATKKKSGSVSQQRAAEPETSEQIKARFAKLRTNVESVIKTGDKAALESIKNDKFIQKMPAEVQKKFTSIPEGGVAKAVASGFDNMYNEIASAINSGDINKVKAIASNPQMPQQMRDNLSKIDANVLAVPQARSQILTGIQKGIEMAKPAVASDAEKKALDESVKGLNDGEKISLASARAIKVAFSKTVATIYLYCIGVAFLAMLATLMMPALPIPKRSKAAPTHVEI